MRVHLQSLGCRLNEAELAGWYTTMIKPAAEFLANGGLVHFRGDRYVITPPASKQERWEEQQGLSPSTTAAVIAGLICAADIARRVAGASQVLVPARRLLPLEGIELVEDAVQVDYVHLLFDRHEIVFAEGAPSTSLRSFSVSGPAPW